ncbi:threonine dehydratase [Rhizobium aquaticum]|uniref:Threonine dehydratase n=1 Tax=Rhizobium aquaticum TaxID=1549636 RepID=A0ABV2IVN0_9HYPH
MAFLSPMTRCLSEDLERDLRFIWSHCVPAGFADLAVDGDKPCQIRLVDESKQYAGSFKFRGAVLGVSKHPQGVIACGSGNFPAAVGLAASKLRTPSMLIMPDDAPVSKKDMALSSGSEVLFVPRSDYLATGEQEAKARGLPLLHPFRDALMLVGSYSLGEELARSIKAGGSEEDAIVVACGGGGLAAGVSLALRNGGLTNDIYVAEPESYPRLQAAIDVLHPVQITPREKTICDALRVTEIGLLPFQILETVGLSTIVGSDTAVVEAQARLESEAGIKAEPSGALALAAALENELSTKYRRLWVVVCGGNV